MPTPLVSQERLSFPPRAQDDAGGHHLAVAVRVAADEPDLHLAPARRLNDPRLLHGLADSPAVVVEPVRASYREVPRLHPIMM